jgi:hypothetical protein
LYGSFVWARAKNSGLVSGPGSAGLPGAAANAGEKDANLAQKFANFSFLLLYFQFLHRNARDKLGSFGPDALLAAPR